MKAIFLGLTLLLGTALAPQPPNTMQDTIQFEIKNAGFKAEGHFSKFEVETHFDPDSVANSSFAATIQVKSIDTGIGLRDQHLVKEEYFHAEKYPEIRFASTEVKPKVKGFEVTGTLTIKGVSKKITLPVKYTQVEDHWRLKTEVELNRLDFGVGDKSWVLSKNLKAIITVFLPAEGE